MERHNSLTEGPLVSSLIMFTIPFLLSNLLQTLYGTVDTLVIGNFGSTAGVSAVATGAQALSLITYFSFGLSSGATVLVSRYVGAGNDRSAAEVVGNTIIDFACLSLILTAITLAGYPMMLRLLNIPAEAVDEASDYMRICSLGIPLIIGYNTVGALLRATGDSKSPLLFVGIACVINIFGDLLLTGAFKMGAAGVAIATVAAQGLSFVFSLLFIMKKGLPFAFGVKDIRFSGRVTGSIAKIGVPMGVQSVLVNLSFMFITAIINAMGVTASAAMGIGDKITGFAFMPQSAFSASVAVVVSQNIGAGKPERTKKAMTVSVLICVVIASLFMAVCEMWPGLFPSMFSKDSDVIYMAGLYMRAYCIDSVLPSVTFCMSGYLNGCGKTTYNMAQNLIATFLVRVPATYLMSRLPNTDLFLIGLAAPISTVFSLAALIIYIRRLKVETIEL